MHIRERRWGGGLIRSSADGRFNNHFYSTQKSISNDDFVNTNRAVSSGAGYRTDAINWVLNKDILLSSWVKIAEESDEGRMKYFKWLDLELDWQELDFDTNNSLSKHRVDVGDDYYIAYEFNDYRHNDYGIDDAFKYFKLSFAGNEEERRKYQAKLFVSLGFMIHLLQDLHSPAHVRDGTHPFGDYLEIFGRYKGGFYLRNNNWGSFDIEIWNEIKNIDAKAIIKSNGYTSYEDYFYKEAQWVSKNFFSESHASIDDTLAWFFNATPNITNEDGGNLDYDNWFDSDTILDDNPLPSEDTTSAELIANSKKKNCILWSKYPWNYIKTYQDNTNENKTFSNDKANNVLAIVEKGCLFDSERMMAITKDDDTKVGYAKYDKTPLLHTAKNVIPRAIVSTQGFINYFFRGRMEASFKEENGMLTIRNNSSGKWVSSDELLTFKKGASIEVYYTGENNISALIHSATLPRDVAIGDTIVFDINSSVQGIDFDYDKANKDKKMLALLDGQIGEDLGGRDSYEIDQRGLAADYATVERYTPIVTKDTSIYTVKKTGQTVQLLYKGDTYRDDGHYQAGADIQYERVGEVVVDRVTGLVWQDDGAHSKTYSTISGYCESLELGGYKNWRMPSIRELSTLLEYGDTSISSAFVSTSSIYYSSTQYKPEGEDWVWYINFADRELEGSNMKNNRSSSFMCVTEAQ